MQGESLSPSRSFASNPRLLQALLNKNAKVYLAARSKSRADEAIEWLKSETNGKAPIFLELDLSNLASVRKAAEEFKRWV